MYLASLVRRRPSALLLPLALVLVQGCLGGGDDGGTGPSDGSTVLTSGAAVTNISGGEGSQKLYRIAVASGASALSVATAGGTGDLDLYVRRGAAPTATEFDCQSTGTDNSESCQISSPAAGDWYIMLYGYEAYSGASLMAVGGSGGGTPTDSTPSRQIFFRVQQDLTYPSGSGAAWCDIPSTNFTDNNPGIPDIPSAHSTSYFGPSEPGTFNAQHTMGSTTVNFTYTLAQPAAGYNRYYTQVIRDYNDSLNRCLDVSKESGRLTFYDEPVP